MSSTCFLASFVGKFCQILFSGCKRDVGNVSANQRPEWPYLFLVWPKNTNLVENIAYLLPAKFCQIQGCYLCFPISPSLVEDNEYLLPVKFCPILFDGSKGSKKCLSQWVVRVDISNKPVYDTPFPYGHNKLHVFSYHFQVVYDDEDQSVLFFSYRVNFCEILLVKCRQHFFVLVITLNFIQRWFLMIIGILILGLLVRVSWSKECWLFTRMTLAAHGIDLHWFTWIMETWTSNVTSLYSWTKGN